MIELVIDQRRRSCPMSDESVPLNREHLRLGKLAALVSG